MAYTYNLTSGNFPVPVGPSLTGISDTSPISSSIPAGTASLINQASSRTSLAAASGGNGVYAIISGITLTPTTGLTFSTSAGLALGDDFIQLVASPSGPWQFAVPADFTVGASLTTYIWLSASGTIVTSTTIAKPASGKVFLGTVTSNATEITNIDGSGVVTIESGIATRRTADIWTPSDTPVTCGLVQTLTTYGNYLWNGSQWLKLVAEMSASQTISANLSLSANSPQVQWITASASGLIVTLPQVTQIIGSNSFTIYNTGSTNSFEVKSYGGTVICTVGTGEYVELLSIPYSGGAGWPASVTPVAIPAGTS